MPFIRWNRNAVLRRLVVGTLALGLTMGGTIWAQPAPASNPQDPEASMPERQGPDTNQKNTGGPDDQQNEAPKGGAPYPAIGEVSNDLPDGVDVVRMGPEEYVFHEGVFYARDPQGFKVVEPPTGIMIRRLPVGFETLIVADTTYFVFADVYYCRTTGGYEVVEPPQNAAILREMSVDEKGKTLAVNVDMLNVRSGPGVDHPAVSQLHMGDTLTIQGTLGKWCYVALPDGSFGWVLSEFTRPEPPGDEG